MAKTLDLGASVVPCWAASGGGGLGELRRVEIDELGADGDEGVELADDSSLAEATFLSTILEPEVIVADIEPTTRCGGVGSVAGPCSTA